jgi:hypothetical protein
MKKLGLLGLLVCYLCATAIAQQLSNDDKKVLETARSRYYSLEQQGLVSFQCIARFDLATIPPQLLPPEDVADRTILRNSTLSLKYERKGPTVTRRYPDGTTDVAEAGVTKLIDWMTSLVNGFFMSWPTKGLQGPIPPFDSQIEKVVPTSSGYEVVLNASGGPVTVEMDKQYLVTRIVSIHGMVDERPVFVETSGGLVYSGTHTITENQQGEKTDIRFDIDSAIVDGLRLPNLVRLRVNDNVDVKFALSGCSATKGTVINVAPPKKN